MTTDSNHRKLVAPNVLDRRFDGWPINRAWVGDITYVPLRGGAFCYLALLMDRFSRALVGWRLGETMTDELTLGALRLAIGQRQPPTGLIHHTDRGGQYASVRYRNVLRRSEMRQSMSRAANCYDNAFMESCFGTVKTELEMTEYKDSRQARQDIASYLAYYNLDRRHSSLDYLAPAAFEAQINQSI